MYRREKLVSVHLAVGGLAAARANPPLGRDSSCPPLYKQNIPATITLRAQCPPEDYYVGAAL